VPKLLANPVIEDYTIEFVPHRKLLAERCLEALRLQSKSDTHPLEGFRR